MRICFNVNGVGLANNGGSRTLIRCAETLRSMGHDAFFFSGPSAYTWHKHDVPLRGGKTHPPADVSIATGVNSLPSVTRYAGRRAYYVRGLELWKTSENKLVDGFKQLSGGVFVNSQWLLEYMRENGVRAHLQYPGLDGHLFHDLGENEMRQGVGALRNNRHRTKRDVDIDALQAKLGFEIRCLNRHIKRASPKRLNKFYNDIKVWFAPTELEGLHNPPIEAALAGCALVCTDHPRAGMADYAVHGKTALVYPARNLDKAAEYVQLLLDDEPLRVSLVVALQRKLRDDIGTRHEQMKVFAERLAALERHDGY